MLERRAAALSRNHGTELPDPIQSGSLRAVIQGSQNTVRLAPHFCAIEARRFGVGLVQFVPRPGFGDQPKAARRWTYSRDINLEIEYLRAVAIILVVVHHAGPFLAWTPIAYFGAGTGVDLFFCISGFVISQSFQSFFDQNRREGKLWRAVRAFWVRRIFRLVPSAWLWLLISIGCSWAFNHTGWFYSFEGNVSSAIFT